MDLEKFEEIEAKIMEIVERVGVVKTQWVVVKLHGKLEDKNLIRHNTKFFLLNF